MNIEQRPGYGNLVIHVTTARGAIPLEGAQVMIRNALPPNVPARGDAITTEITDRDGNTRPIRLPTRPREESLRPGNGTPPFQTYQIDVRLEGYYDQNYLNVPIFDGITAIQPVDLIPLSENLRTDSRTPDSQRFFESTAPNL